MKQQPSIQFIGVVRDQTGDDWAAEGTANRVHAQTLGVSANTWHDTLLDEKLATVETFERGSEMRGVFAKPVLVDRRPEIHRDSVDVDKAEFLESEKQIGAVQAAAEHGDNGGVSLGEPRNMPKTFNGPVCPKAGVGVSSLHWLASLLESVD